MMKQDTTRALQQSQIKWNDKNTSAAISYIYSRQIIHKTNPDKVQTEITLTQTYETIQTTTVHIYNTSDI